jgi:agmatine deiminase
MQDTVYISEYLNKVGRGKPVVHQLRKLEAEGHFQIREIRQNRNEWCRDYMPVRGANRKQVLFNYKPHYLASSIKGSATIPDQRLICRELGLDFIDASDLTLDGGAIDIYSDIALVSETFLRMNGDMKSCKDSIRVKLGLGKVIVIPPDPWDFTGHVDGLVRFIDGSTVLVNDYTPFDTLMARESKYLQKKYFGWRERFNTALSEARLKVELLTGGFYDSHASSAEGVYLNFLHLRDCILMPAFSHHLKENDVAAAQLREYYDKPVFAIVVDGVAKQGGAINCITWSI